MATPASRVSAMAVFLTVIVLLEISSTYAQQVFTTASCSSLGAVNGFTSQPNTNSPYVIQIAPQYYTTGTIITVTVYANQPAGRMLRELICQARDTATNSPVGTFTSVNGNPLLPTNDYNVYNCGSQTATTVGTTNNNIKSTPVVLTYQAAAPAPGNIGFRTSDNLRSLPFHIVGNFCCINMQSVRNKADEFVDFVQDKSLDVVAISETWLREDDIILCGDITPVGYSFQLVPRKEKTGGGVGILFRSSLSLKIKSHEKVYNSFKAIHAELTVNSRTVNLVALYRPADSSFGSFLSDFGELIVDYLPSQSDVMFCGDFNIHVDDTSDSKAHRFQNLLLSFGLTQHITYPTHKFGHTLDLIITREHSTSLLSDICVLPGLSDHYALSCNLNLQKPPLPSVTIKTRNLKALDLVNYSADICSAFADSHLEYQDLDTCVNLYESILRDTLDRHAPVKIKTLRVRPSSPWFPDEIRSARKIRRQHEMKWMNSRLEVDHQEYCKQRNIVNNLIRHAKIEYIFLLK
ncbi:putative RNA-directed DNA polymerase from mobile element jockey-like [Apostichopus japonicus]|uniref:Putative RNA-directed DNA polymerase from mobile element jockey-like n=1 Tax=Stichopus japonicus TaxID=307972 RepID=A0A2G8KIM6_STIJA|nr:putative RNA-directed DNA polymerase from mobile element jockey-like [Apostichopus japonicus]